MTCMRVGRSLKGCLGWTRDPDSRIIRWPGGAQEETGRPASADLGPWSGAIPVELGVDGRGHGFRVQAPPHEAGDAPRLLEGARQDGGVLDLERLELGLLREHEPRP